MKLFEPSVPSVAPFTEKGTPFEISDAVSVCVAIEPPLRSVNVTGTFGGSGTAWYVTYTVSSGDTNQAQGGIPISVALKDAAGNTCSPYTTVTGGTPGVDTFAPVITSASFSQPSGWLKAGSSVTLSITTALSETGLTPSSITVNGVNVTGTFGGSDTNWHATYMASVGDTYRAQGAIPVSIALTDAAGNTYSTSAVTGNTLGVDTVAPSGYSASITQPYVNSSNVSSVNMSFAGAETDDSYSYSISSSGGTWGPITGTVSSSNQSFYGLNLSGLGDGTLTVSLTLTDPAGNMGTPAVTTKTKDTMAPSGYSASITQPYVNASNFNSVSMSFAGAEKDDSYSCSISSSGGGTLILSGTVTSPTQTFSGLNLSGLGDGTLTVSLTLTDPAGNLGTPAATTKTKDTMAPSGYSASINQLYVNSSNVFSVNMSFAGAEVGASYSYSISSLAGC